jgi:uncharacterized lipoprotein YddW (UPF0748 family)
LPNQILDDCQLSLLMNIKKCRRNFCLGISVLLGLLLALMLHQAPPHPAIAKSKQPELRAVWLTNMGASFLHHTTQVDEALHQLAKLNFNTLYPAVWNRGYTLYPSPIAQKNGVSDRDPLLAMPFQDVLANMTREAHRQGLAIVPWFEYGFMIPASSNLVKSHPDWISRTRQGQQILNPHSQGSFAHRLPPFLKNAILEITGANTAWLNPLHPQVQQFLISLISDVIQRYDVDGIQLDDHFGMPVTLGYDPYTVKLYQQQHGGDLPPDNPYNPDWMAWRANQLTEFMAQLAQALRTRKADILISLSPNPAAFAYRESLQDWPRWVREKLVDEIIVQVYRDQIPSLEAELAQASLQQAQQMVPVSIGLFTGPLSEPKAIASVAQQVQAVRQWRYNGIAFFCWESTLGFAKRESGSNIEQALHKLFPTRTSPPS